MRNEKVDLSTLTTGLNEATAALERAGEAAKKASHALTFIPRSAYGVPLISPQERALRRKKTKAQRAARRRNRSK